MDSPASQPASRTSPSENTVLFASENQPRKESERNRLPWIVAAVSILIIVSLACFFTDRTTSQPASNVNPYAAQITIRHVQLSHATNFAGDPLTYVEGIVTNHGNRTVTAMSVRVLFANNESEQPQAEQVPLNLVRTHEPYVDTEPVSANPLTPGASQGFRLIFDDIYPLWNQQIPALQIESVSTQP